MEEDIEEDEAVCIFIGLLSNCLKRQTTDLVKLSETHLQTVIRGSKRSKDNLDIPDNDEIVAYKACVLEYKSFDHINRHLKYKSNGK